MSAVTAGTLRRSSLPSHFSVRVLPDVKYAKNYPAIGPDGVSVADVNGRAVTIEMMFGEAVLRHAGKGNLPPVRWGGPVGSSGVYQGAIEFKRQAQDAVSVALDLGDSLDKLDPGVAEGCRSLTSLLIDAASNISPMMTSEFSPLLLERVRQS